MSDDQALPRNPLISAATWKGQSRAVMEITRFETSIRVFQGSICPVDNSGRLLLPLLCSHSCCPGTQAKESPATASPCSRGDNGGLGSVASPGALPARLGPPRSPHPVPKPRCSLPKSENDCN